MDFFSTSSLKPTSIKLFNSKLNEWIGYMPEHYQSVISIILLPTFAMKTLENNLVVNTNTNKHVFIMSILSFFRHCRPILLHLPDQQVEHLRSEWVKIYEENEAPIIKRRLENKPTDNQIKKEGSHLEFTNIVQVRDSLPPGSPERLLIAMYTMIPPVRADYFATQIVRGEEKPIQPNYIRIISDNHIESVLTDFKTAQKYKQITNTFPPELINELITSLQKTPRSYLFLNSNGTPHTRNSFTIWSRRTLSRVLAKDFTLVFFRHIFATHWILTHDMNTVTDLEIKQVSEKMGHSSEMFRAYRWVANGRHGELQINHQEHDD
jgi:integrase